MDRPKDTWPTVVWLAEQRADFCDWLNREPDVAVLAPNQSGGKCNYFECSQQFCLEWKFARLLSELMETDTLKNVGKQSVSPVLLHMCSERPSRVWPHLDLAFKKTNNAQAATEHTGDFFFFFFFFNWLKLQI